MEKRQITILCGGKSSRMGQDKAMLPIQGRTFLETLIEEFGSKAKTNETNEMYEEILLSVGKGRRYDIRCDQKIRYVEDIYPSCGPLGGLHAVMSACKEETEAVFVVTVDLPRADRELMYELEAYLQPGIDAVVPISADGRIHPLCAWYRCGIKEQLERRLQEGNYRVRDLLQGMRVCCVPEIMLTKGAWKLSNINTPGEYKRLLGGRIPVISLAAYSGSGKTTFLEKLIGELKQRGLRIAVLKHDGHDFDLDREGKDSWRFTKAGADQVLLLSRTKAAQMYHKPMTAEELIAQIKDVDLILTEGLKHEAFPKILLYRRAAGKPPAVDPETEQPLLIVSDQTKWPGADCPVLGLSDIEQTADFIIRRYIQDMPEGIGREET